MSDLLEFASSNEGRFPLEDDARGAEIDVEPADDPSALFFREAMSEESSREYETLLPVADNVLPELFADYTVADVSERARCAPMAPRRIPRGRRPVHVEG